VRLVYNLALAQREMFGRRGRQLDPQGELPDLKKEFPFLKEEAFSQSLQEAIRDLDKAFANFFAGRAGYPTSRKKFENDSMRFPQPYHKRKGVQIVLGRDSVKLPKFGWLTIIRHRKIKGRLRNVTVKREGERWFVVLQTEIEAKEPVLRADLPAVGLDMGVNQPVTTSTGEVIALPQVSKAENVRRAHLDRVLSRRKKGSAGRRQARLALRRFHRHVADRRNDARQKVTTRLVKSHGLIGIEDLKVRNMTASTRGATEQPGRNIPQKAGLNRRLLDVAPYEFRRLLEYKGVWHGSAVIAVSPAYTSQDCSGCGCRCLIGRSERIFVCPHCGLIIDRDWNAALNVKLRALVEYGRRTGGVCPWIEPECRPEAGTPKAAMIVLAAMQVGRSLARQGEV
jgi:putative transposase